MGHTPLFSLGRNHTCAQMIVEEPNMLSIDWPEAKHAVIGQKANMLSIDWSEVKHVLIGQKPNMSLTMPDATNACF